MPRTRPLLRRDITYTSAKEREVNILHQLKYYHQRNQFFAHLDNNRPWIENVVAHHLGLNSSGMCHVLEREHWLHGSFNVCIPVTIQSRNEKRVLIRFPLPYRVGEEFNPGNGDEKIRCEAGTYAWLQENCPDIPIPQLYGFGLSTGETVRTRLSVPTLLWLTRPSSLDLNICQHSHAGFTSFAGNFLHGLDYPFLQSTFHTKMPLLVTP